MMKKFFHILVIASFGLFSICSFAKDINLYDQPKASAKTSGTIDLAKGIIPIYIPNKDWVKVADPHNGNVGWVKAEDLKHAGLMQTNITVSQGNDKGTSTYQILQYGEPKTLTKEEQQKLIQQIQAQQQAFQKSMQAMQNDMNQLFNDTMNNNFPIMLPTVVLVPEKSADKPKQ